MEEDEENAVGYPVFQAQKSSLGNSTASPSEEEKLHVLHAIDVLSSKFAKKIVISSSKKQVRSLPAFLHTWTLRPTCFTMKPTQYKLICRWDNSLALQQRFTMIIHLMQPGRNVSRYDSL